MLLNKKTSVKKTSLFSSLLVIFLFSCAEKKSCNPADLVFINTSIYTATESNPKAEALAILGDTIVFVGSNNLAKDYQCGQAKVVDLSSSYIYPGFVDSHAHLKGIGYRDCLLYTSPSPRDATLCRMPSSA